MSNSRSLAGRLKVLIAFLLVFGPASLLVFIGTRGCEHKFKVLKDFGPIKSTSFQTYESGSFKSANIADYKGDILLVTTLQKTCPGDCAISMWHMDQMLFQHIRKNKRKKLKQVRIISFVTDGKGNPVSKEDFNVIEQSLKDNVEGYDSKLWILANGDARKIYNFKHNGQSLIQKGKKYYGGESFQELILLLDKQAHLRMVLPGNQEGLVRRMKEHLALLQKQYDKEKKANSK
jgi:hypothetical protein